jgi:hypothetical protein
MGAPQRQTVDHQQPAITIEQVVGADTAQALPHCPDVHVDDATAERTIKRPDPEFGLGGFGRVGYHGWLSAGRSSESEIYRRRRYRDSVEAAVLPRVRRGRLRRTVKVLNPHMTMLVAPTI